MSDRIKMTEEMYEEYNRRAEILSRSYSQALQLLEQARAEGDISDNAGHDIAIRERDHLGTELGTVLDIIERADVFRGAISTSNCSMFTYVTLEDMVFHKVMTIQLVDEGQGRPPVGEDSVGRVSMTSILGRDLIGKPKGAVVSYLDNDLRQRMFRVLDIKDHPPKATEVDNPLATRAASAVGAEPTKAFIES